MRIHVLSDLHLEMRPYLPTPVEADVVVLAGDIANGAEGVHWARRHFTQPVLYVAGNHEPWEGEFAATQAMMAEAARDSNVQLMDCTRVDLQGTRFLGCSLWTDFSLAPESERAAVIERSRQFNPDHRMIRIGERNFSVEDSIAWCKAQRQWLSEQLAQPYAGETVVITHFAPHPGSIAPSFARHPANPGFVLDLSPLMGKAALWIHGHTHTAFDYWVQGTRIVCNPRGYAHEYTGFQPRKVFAL